jgi:hypothetical protein
MYLTDTVIKYLPTTQDTRRSRVRTLSKYSLEGDPLGLSPFSLHRSVKKHLTTSLVSSRTSTSRRWRPPCLSLRLPPWSHHVLPLYADGDPRVFPFCPDVIVPSQDFILLSFLRKIDRKKKSHRHLTVTLISFGVVK